MRSSTSTPIYASLRFGHQASRPARGERGIDARQQALRRRLFVAGGAVDLAGEIQAADELALQAALEAARIEEVVLDGIAGPRDVRVLEPFDGAHELELHVEGQAGRDPVGIDLVRDPGLRAR